MEEILHHLVQDFLYQQVWFPLSSSEESLPEGFFCFDVFHWLGLWYLVIMDVQDNPKMYRIFLFNLGTFFGFHVAFLVGIQYIAWLSFCTLWWPGEKEMMKTRGAHPRRDCETPRCATAGSCFAAFPAFLPSMNPWIRFVFEKKNSVKGILVGWYQEVSAWCTLWQV